MIPLFPKFKKLELSDKKEIGSFTKKFPPYSDYNFTSMYCYNTEDKMRVSWLNGNLVVRFQDYLTSGLFYSFLGTKKVVETADTLLKYSMKKHLKPMLKLIPEVVIKADEKLKQVLRVKEDRDNFDYIYKILDLSHLKGKKYYSKLKQLKNFKKDILNFKLVVLDLKKKETQRSIREIFLIWLKKKSYIDRHYRKEFVALKRLFNACSFIHVLTIGIIFKNQLKGIAIAELVNKNNAIFHFIKADLFHKSVFTVLYNGIAKYIQSCGKYHYLNNEQDLGISNLRKAKEQWKQFAFLKKYTISLKE